jgi:plastocyanin
MNSHLRYLALPIAIAALLVGCGGDDNSSDTSSTTETTTTQTEAPATEQTSGDTVDLQANPEGALAYEETSLTAKSGTVSIDFTNDSPIGHDVVVDQDGKEISRTPIITEDSAVTTFDAKPGTYTFYCSVPGHREAGMEGTLTVK